MPALQIPDLIKFFKLLHAFVRQEIVLYFHMKNNNSMEEFSVHPEEAQWKLAKELYDDDKLFQAARIVRNLRRVPVEETVESSGTISENNASLVRKSIRRILKESEECEKFLSLLLDEREWECLSKESDRCRVYYNSKEGPRIHGFKIETEIDAPFLATASLINEVDLLQELFWYVGSSEEIAKLSRCKKLLRSRFVTPWPFAPREAILYGYAVDGLDEDHSVVVCFRSAEPEDFKDGSYESISSDSKDTVRLDVKIGGIQFIPLERCKTLFRTAVFADPQVPYIPKWLFHWVSKRSSSRHFPIVNE
ncbi:uncharacterized protein Gasu_04040 [Galdieria sulphuraria]|uniref:START domain-containing protein n=1 Tax=Galdieria sulphuraria TaxID=130081 RepID=M2Y8Z4_GALSU|nr:uncharacterized protein Gasu_04040 [Galdieria sulphuraria]EME32309.1 hypothetical protein Gasu_04040 [Galdieria sulphuraria]|eukprot:XP_005708829.1 hypothetical protein Gasu_04040 [Galdieria sulphuraria]